MKGGQRSKPTTPAPEPAPRVTTVNVFLDDTRPFNVFVNCDDHICQFRISNNDIGSCSLTELHIQNGKCVYSKEN